MGRHDHNKFNKPAFEEPVLDVVEGAIVEATVEAAFNEPVEDTIEEPVEEATTEPEVNSEVGTVVGCKDLRVRALPSVNGAVKCTIPKGTTVVIDPIESTDEFYSVCTEIGVTGYCMRKYIEVVSN